MELVSQIFQLCIFPLLGLLSKYFIDFLKAKKDEANSKIDNDTIKKYNDMIYDTIRDCVVATNQTYVNSLKESGQFDEAAQKEAFNKTMSAVMAVLSEDAKQYIIETTGDINIYLTTKIEKEVNSKRENKAE